MASIFTYQDEPPRIQSPWSTPGYNTPHAEHAPSTPSSEGTLMIKLEPERQDGPTEYKLHLLLRPRRKFVSISTADAVPGSYHSRPGSLIPASRSISESLLQRVVSQPSHQIRQNRLQQLTTQLLWRLQQSSPFHSSSNADLIAPVLPDAAPRLGIPDLPAKLMPGLEESQGALYEIGVADDGTLIGLVDDELEESLNNLRAMAASLGCVVDVLRKVRVGNCSWFDTENETRPDQIHAGELWVAEVLVRPDSFTSLSISKSLQDQVDVTATEANFPMTSNLPRHHAQIQQLRITLLGATTSGKSSLLGTLSTSVLDNGRGKSRLSLLKHRHEIASGITSSVAHELVGYPRLGVGSTGVINYASDNVSAWTDIHNLATRLAFLSDSPGSPRFAKSTLRALMSWKPHWTIFCIAANELDDDPITYATDTAVARYDLSLVYLQLCLKLDLPLVVVITKMDLATRGGLRAVLGKVLSTLKEAHRKPMILNTATNSFSNPVQHNDSMDYANNTRYISRADVDEVDQVIDAFCSDELTRTVPILMTSAATGVGIGKLHALLFRLPSKVPTCLTDSNKNTHDLHLQTGSQLFHIDEVFSIPPSKVYHTSSIEHSAPHGVVLCGYVDQGVIRIGDEMCVGPFLFEDDETMVDSQTESQDPKSPRIQTRRSSRSTSNLLTRSLSGARHTTEERPTAPVCGFITVRVVSVRNLRLSVRTIHAGETGTIGVESIDSRDKSFQLQRARKGMVLKSCSPDLHAYKGMTVSFDTADFPLTSSPLILGGHTTVYVNSIRTTVKVTGMILDEPNSDVHDVSGHHFKTSAASTQLFNLDDDDDSNRPENDSASATSADSVDVESRVKISFRFVNTVEWMKIGDKVLVVPNSSSNGAFTSAGIGVARSLGTTPPASNHAAGLGMSSVAGLSGFVGVVCDLMVS